MFTTQCTSRRDYVWECNLCTVVIKMPSYSIVIKLSKNGVERMLKYIAVNKLYKRLSNSVDDIGIQVQNLEKTVPKKPLEIEYQKIALSSWKTSR